ncbi:Crossover junction endonuclease MUS81 [Stylophora pistillata]|uniref:Crossover junction endonuclease MUS81 n=1 Tax=Stylophora pistillata TaxID=50429 RepID=A0A2B4RLV5_STYPI|nr:Crossover junction endonuclease MUS81 [Stylophora pistillata]
MITRICFQATTLKQAVGGITKAVMLDLPSEGFPPDSNVHYSVQTPRAMIARRLNEAMKKYSVNNHQEVFANHALEDEYTTDPVLDSLLVPTPPSIEINDDILEEEPKKKKEPRRKITLEYVPAFRSGPYALIITLYQHSQSLNFPGYMTRAELQKEAQPLCDASFTKPDPGSHYTAWSSMSALIKKGFITKTSNPARYSITDQGCILAQKLNRVSGDRLSMVSSHCTAAITTNLASSNLVDTKSGSKLCVSSSSGVSTSKPVIDFKQMALSDASATSFEGFTSIVVKRELNPKRIVEADVDFDPGFVLRPGTFDVILCVDVNETTAEVNSRKDALIPELKNNGVQFDVRKLQLGDFLWVARERPVPVPGCLSVPVARELILDYIVERKRMDDLCGSIIDGRFHEQKFRLRHCGLRHPIYLVEDFGSIQHMSLPENTLLQAIVNTQVVDGFFVKRTRDLKEGVAYLTVMTRYLQKFYANKTLVSCHQGGLEQARLNNEKERNKMYLMNFLDFNDSTAKNKVMTVSEVFAKQLMQLSGVSPDKAVAILDKYPTPKSLLDAYKVQKSVEDQELLLSELKCGENQRTLGSSLSKLIYQLFCSPSLC